MLIAPLVSFDRITLDEGNRCLAAWRHRMGPLTRPPEYGCWVHGLRHNGELVAVATASSLIRETCAGLTRAEAVELSRLCASRPGLCRVALRLWREFVFPALARSRGVQWAVSYQDADLHSGNTYRFDGWVPLGRGQSGAVDPRSGRKGRRTRIWGWHPDAAARAARKERAA